MKHAQPSEFLNAQLVMDFPDPRGYPTKAELDAFFTYDAETGKLYNRVTRGRAKAGNEAGSLHDTGGGRFYRRMSFKGRLLYVHSAIYIMHNDGIPVNHEIDHRDHDRLNNRTDNLRAALHIENSRNMPIYSRNVSGVMGVRRAGGKWRAEIRNEGKTVHLGMFAEKADAAKARKNAERRFGFYENHGRKLAA